jgi:hypothetical protein
MTDELAPDAIDPELAPLAERLTRERPVPSAGFRSTVHQRLIALEVNGHPRPTHLWAAISILSASGTLLFALVGLGLTGSGPFAP